MPRSYSGPGPASAQPHPQTLRSRPGVPGLTATRRSVGARARSATAAPAAAPSIAAAPAAAALPRLGDGELATADVVAVQLLDGAFGFLGRAPLHEAEP